MDVVDLDYALLRQVAKGNEQAFAELMRRHQDRVYRLALRLLRRPQEAEDAAQEVFLKAFQHASRFTPSGTVAAWLNRITANHCLNRLRSQAVRKEVPLERPQAQDAPAYDLSELVTSNDDPGELLAGKELAIKLQEALSALPENQRQALLLKRDGDFSYQEIGELLGISASAVDGLIKRARQRLRQVLAEYF
ncbi:RNA polymerase sigma factor [Desulfobacca acetoxidans]|uniref:RNA polymerase, sigma-24 subunit, ECF subfamily n=1 Tax=Desulfobacca acetoxidans (strain ATCC 700848 / DSM 11109 / ASRB2) TaxID=880072 RepID=F2NF35_DESAR|nr:RNA polymerase sigma factor [Desulfobacca acetoxidans]AEB08375.1 RNA polymerase, sigma-24 subunit, ECF subfamily [Desulfobacca acetoxidans DSM 11109]HAY22781.1 RNA polymerase sigma factor [Desulfobacterales bacterium]